MAFDADQWAAARYVPPSFTWKGRRYVGEIMSAEQWTLLHAKREDDALAQQARAIVAANADNEPGFSAKTVEETVRATFEANDRFARRCVTGWFRAPWHLRPLAALFPDLFHPAWRAFRQMPPGAQVDAVKDFSESQRKAMPESPPPGTTQTNQAPAPRSDT